MKRLGAISFALFLAVFAGCGGDTGGPNPPPPPPPPPPPAPVATVEVTPASPAVTVGQTVQLTATPKTAAGAAVTGKTVQWSSSATATATVATDGVVTALSPGQATITATVDAVSGTASVTVLPLQAATCTDCLEVVPNTLLLPSAGATQQLVAFQVNATGGRTAVNATFESSNTSAVTVTQGGLATAASATGSSQVTAHAGNLTSAPVLALVAQPAAGALLVSDNQIQGAPTPVDPDADYKPGYQYRVRLRGASPAVGQVVLGSGSSPVGGRVVSSADAGQGLRDVVLEILPLNEMFTGLSIAQDFSLEDAVSVVPDGVREAFIVERAPSGAIRYTPRGPRRLSPTGFRPSPVQGAAPNVFEFELGPYSCEAKLEGALTFPAVLDAFSFTVNPNLGLDLLVTNGQVQRIVVTGDITPTVASDLLINAALKGSVECKVELRKVILPIGGPISLIIGGQIPLGVGFAIEAKMELSGIGFDAFYTSTVTARFGIECVGPCAAVGTLTGDAGGFFKPRLPASFNELRTELAASLFGFAQLQLGNPFINQLQFKAVEIKAGLEQKAELASAKGQADDASYASSFSLSPLIEAKTASSVTALAELLNIQFAELSFKPTLPQLARSPEGTFTITPAEVAPGSGSQLGDMATFTVALNPVTYLGAYAVEGVELRWLKDDGSGNLVLQNGRPGCTSLTPAASGQATFTCQTDFLDTDTGPQTFFAFVKAKFFGVPVPILLEVGSNGSAVVEVTGLTITTTQLPGGVRDAPYSSTVQSTGGTGNNAWSIASGQLPPGLSIASSTGEIAGTPTAEGNFPFTAKVVSGNQSDEQALAILVGPAQVLEWLFTEDLDGWSPIGNTIHRNDVEGHDVARLDGGGAMAKSIALPSGITTFEFLVSAHNRPSSTTHFTIQVIRSQGTTTILDRHLTGPAGGGYRYVIVTADLAPFAGQTVTIRINQFPLNNGQLYIDRITIR